MQQRMLKGLSALSMIAALAVPSVSLAKQSTKGLAKFSLSESEAIDKKGDTSGIRNFDRIEGDQAYAFVKGTVTAVSASSISVSVKHHPEDGSATIITTVYTFSIDAKTKTIRKFKGSATIGEVAVGDTVSVWGSDLTNGRARMIWDQSIWWGEVKGTITNLDATNKTFQLILKSSENHGITTTSVATIHVSDATVYLMGTTTKAWTDLANDQKVTVRGSWNKAGKFFLAAKVTIKS